MSTAENPSIPTVADPARQLPSADLFLPAKVAAVADWVGRTQARTGELFRTAYYSSRAAYISFVEELRGRSRRIKEENPMALLAGIAGTAFALGIAARYWRSRR